MFSIFFFDLMVHVQSYHRNNGFFVAYGFRFLTDMT